MRWNPQQSALLGMFLMEGSTAFFTPSMVAQQPKIVPQATASPVFAFAKPSASRLPPLTPERLHGMSLTQWRMELAARYPEAAELQWLMASLATALKSISCSVSRAAIVSAGGGGDVSPVQQKQAANQAISTALRCTGRIGVLAGVGMDPVLIEDDDNIPNFVTVFDPLDGAASMSYNGAPGTIFGIFRDEGDECLIDYSLDFREQVLAEEKCLMRTLQPGDNLVAAGYCMYSSTTILVIAVKHEGVHGFSLDPLLGEFVCTHPHIRIPEKGKIYSFDEADRDLWPPELNRYVEDVKRGESPVSDGKRYQSRFIGSMVADVHRTLIYGGVWGNPGTRAYPEGKLRVLNEAGPMAFIVEQAGGAAIDGTGKCRLLDLRPQHIQHRTVGYMGSKDDIAELGRYLAKEV